jgi:excinuclease UvrABC nuclease subunit
MRANMLKGDYENSINCSRRLIENCGLMRIDFDNLDNEIVSAKIEKAEKNIKRCQILSKFPTAEIADLALKMEECAQNEEYEEAARLKRLIESKK